MGRSWPAESVANIGPNLCAKFPMLVEYRRQTHGDYSEDARGSTLGAILGVASVQRPARPRAVVEHFVATSGVVFKWAVEFPETSLRWSASAPRAESPPDQAHTHHPRTARDSRLRQQRVHAARLPRVRQLLEQPPLGKSGGPAARESTENLALRGQVWDTCRCARWGGSSRTNRGNHIDSPAFTATYEYKARETEWQRACEHVWGSVLGFHCRSIPGFSHGRPGQGGVSNDQGSEPGVAGLAPRCWRWSYFGSIWSSSGSSASQARPSPKATPAPKYYPEARRTPTLDRQPSGDVPLLRGPPLTKNERASRSRSTVRGAQAAEGGAPALPQKRIHERAHRRPF